MEGGREERGGGGERGGEGEREGGEGGGGGHSVIIWCPDYNRHGYQWKRNCGGLHTEARPR